jgi:hypothetical protein
LWHRADLHNDADDGFDEATFTQDFQEAQGKFVLKRAQETGVKKT